MISTSPAHSRMLAALEAHGCRRGSSGSWTCPAHEDSNPSLSVSAGSDGRVLVHCHAGCEQADVVSALGLTMGDLFDEPLQTNGNGNGSHRSIVATYPYHDESGELLFEVVRMTPKDFRQRRPDPSSSDGWNWSTKGIRRVVYRLPAVIAATAAGRRVFVVEGEKDVHAIEAAGEVATCNPGGAKKWRPEYAEAFNGAEVVIVADRDEVGREHARIVQTALEGVAKSVMVVEPAAGKDAADHLAEGMKLDQFVSADEDSWAPAADIYALVRSKPEPPDILSSERGGLFYRGKRHLVTGEPETLKSWIAAAAAAELMSAGENVGWWDSDEMGAGPLTERLEGFGADPKAISARLLYFTPERAFDDSAKATVIRAIDARPPALFVIDAMNPSMELQGLNPMVTAEVQNFYRTIVGLFHRRGIATVIIDHVSKDKETRGRWATGSERKVGGVDVHFNIELIGEPPTRERPQGRAIVRGGKDRPGWHIRADGRRVGEFVMDLDDEKPWRLELGRVGAGDGRIRPTFLMQRVSEYLEREIHEVSKSQIETDVKGKATGIRTALHVLTDEKYIARSLGPNKTQKFISLRPYREAEDSQKVQGTDRGRTGDDEWDEVSGLSPVRPSENPLNKRPVPPVPSPSPGPSRTPPERVESVPLEGPPYGGDPGDGSAGREDIVENWRELL